MRVVLATRRQIKLSVFANGAQTNILCMNTLSDIIALGNAAATAGEPLVTNWPQMRGALYLLGHAGGGIDQVRTSDFEIRYPADYAALDPAIQATLPSKRTYETMRHQVSRLLACLGEIDDPWEQLRMLIRRAGKDDIERCLPGLATPAKAAGLVPAQITTDWVWSLDAERGVLSEEQLQRRFDRERRHGKAPKAKLACSVRQRLRQGVSVFNRLFQIPEIAASGLLPPEPIAAPPVYDRQGRLKLDLPSILTHYHAAAPETRRDGLPQVWQAMCNAGIYMPTDNPTADDMLAPDMWTRITQLQPCDTGVTNASWRQYISRARQLLLPHLTHPVSASDTLPQWLDKMTIKKTDRMPLLQLWWLLIDRDMTDVTPDDILDLTTWRELWSQMPSRLKPRTWTIYERRARALMSRHATVQIDPYRIVTRAWADLPKNAKAALDPIRKTAERALLRPLDLSPEWVAQQGLHSAQEMEVTDTLREVFFAAALVRRPDPSAVAWEALRTAIKDQGISTIGLAKVSSLAIDDSKAPVDLTLEWATKKAAQMDQKKRAEFTIHLRKLDSLLSILDLAPILYAEPISAVPDLRKRGKIEPPEKIMRETDAVTAAHRLQPSTCREARATVRKAWTEVANTVVDVEIDTLEELLSVAVTAKLDQPTHRKVARLLKNMTSMQGPA